MLVKPLLAALCLALAASDALASTHTLRKNGRSCSASTQCISNSCQYSRCATKVHNWGKCYKDNMCHSNSCEQVKNQGRLCVPSTLQNNGQRCAESTQCKSQSCQYSKCANKRADLHACYKDNMCQSGQCGTIKGHQVCLPKVQTKTSSASATSKKTSSASATKAKTTSTSATSTKTSSLSATSSKTHSTTATSARVSATTAKTTSSSATSTRTSLSATSTRTSTSVTSTSISSISPTSTRTSSTSTHGTSTTSSSSSTRLAVSTGTTSSSSTTATLPTISITTIGDQSPTTRATTTSSSSSAPTTTTIPTSIVTIGDQSPSTETTSSDSSPSTLPISVITIGGEEPLPTSVTSADSAASTPHFSSLASVLPIGGEEPSPTSVASTDSTASTPQPTTTTGLFCGVAGFHNKYGPAGTFLDYQSFGTQQSQAQCAAFCQAHAQCMSYMMDDSVGCALFNVPASIEMEPEPNSPFVFYDIACPIQSTSSDASTASTATPQAEPSTVLTIGIDDPSTSTSADSTAIEGTPTDSSSSAAAPTATTSALVCGVAGARNPTILSIAQYSQVTQAQCSAYCQDNASCLSYTMIDDDSTCVLSRLPATLDIDPDEESPFVYYDRNCPVETTSSSSSAASETAAPITGTSIQSVTAPSVTAEASVIISTGIEATPAANSAVIDVTPTASSLTVAEPTSVTTALVCGRVGLRTGFSTLDYGGIYTQQQCDDICHAQAGCLSYSLSPVSRFGCSIYTSSASSASVAEPGSSFTFYDKDCPTGSTSSESVASAAASAASSAVPVVEETSSTASVTKEALPTSIINVGDADAGPTAEATPTGSTVVDPSPTNSVSTTQPTTATASQPICGLVGFVDPDVPSYQLPAQSSQSQCASVCQEDPGCQGFSLPLDSLAGCTVYFSSISDVATSSAFGDSVFYDKSCPVQVAEAAI